AIPFGKCPTGIVATTLLVAVSITETFLESWFATSTKGAASAGQALNPIANTSVAQSAAISFAQKARPPRLRFPRIIDTLPSRQHVVSALSILAEHFRKY